MDDMQKLLADIETASAKTRELMPDIKTRIHMRTGDTTWWKRVPRTDDRVADLAGFLRWANSENLSGDDIDWATAQVFSELSSDDIERAHQLA
ncbi:hypothetical protein [Mesorhizobium sp. SP-1A]|uniref:hypothetical protein n=1 Tax=Mesorhizobium sp. SP-1A TaxID=3077840 RepID=UPI0028F6E741|nr:hypothetical protein [Mesorhizobium sp. SP-1A]